MLVVALGVSERNRINVIDQYWPPHPPPETRNQTEMGKPQRWRVIWLGGSINGGVPPNRWFISWTIRLKWMISVISGYPYFRKPPHLNHMSYFLSCYWWCSLNPMSPHEALEILSRTQIHPSSPESMSRCANPRRVWQWRRSNIFTAQQVVTPQTTYRTVLYHNWSPF